jgi:uncharacterized protein (TIGR02271 family)
VSHRETEVTRREEELDVDRTSEEAGAVRVSKHVDTYPVEQVVERHVERAEAPETAAPHGEDSGEIETLEDGSISIPVFEEEIVVTKRLVVRERIIVRKSRVTDEHRIETELRKERVEIDADAGIDDRVTAERDEAPPPPPPVTP